MTGKYQIITQIKKQLASYSIENNRVAVALSGGVDSVALAVLLKNCGLDIVTVNVNHNLRQEALEQSRYTAKQMESMGIEYHQLQVDGTPTGNIQNWAREERYRLLIGFCKGNNIEHLFLGHHKDDQAETILMRIERGSSVRGLCGMRDLSEREGVKIIRPLLAFGKSELVDYLKDNNINWVEDSSNASDKYRRNRLRKVIGEDGNLTNRLSKMAISMQRADDAINSVVDIEWDNIVTILRQQLTIDYTRFIGLKEEFALRLLSRAVMLIGKRNDIPREEKLQQAYSNIITKQKCTFHNCILDIGTQIKIICEK